MSRLLYRPLTLARALYVGSQAARAASTSMDPDAGGVGLSQQPDGSLRIYSAAGESFSRAYADPARGTDADGEPLAAVLSISGTQTLLACLADLDDTPQAVELRADSAEVHLVRAPQTVLASTANQAGTLTPRDARAVRPADFTSPIPEQLHGAQAALSRDLLQNGPGMDPEDTLDTWGVREREDLLVWWLGDWALGRLHADATSPRR